ncbi:hypothetical protein Tco_0807500 [Tanacetum coccineum]
MLNRHKNWLVHKQTACGKGFSNPFMVGCRDLFLRGTHTHEAGQILDEEQLAFLADLGVPDGQASQTIIPNNTTFQTEDLDTYDSDCDDLSNAQAVLMANISNYGSDVIFEVSHFDIYLNDDMENQKKLALIEQVDSLEQNLSKQIKENESLLQTFTVFKSESKEKEDKCMENEIDLEKKIKELDNIIYKVCQSTQKVHMLTKPQGFYDNIRKQALETLILEEDSRSKMSEKAKDPEVIQKKFSHKPIAYEKLNRLTEDFGKHFTPQQELSAEQAFWLRISNPTIKSSDEPPVKVEVLNELPKASLVNASLKKLKFHLAQFEHTKAVFNNEIIPFLKSLKDIFNVFDNDILNDITKELLLENDRLLKQNMSRDVLLTVMNSMSVNNESVNVELQRSESCDKYFNLDTELSKSQHAYNDLLKSHSQLKKHCISLEFSIQLNQEIFQKGESCDNQNALEIPKYFENNDLKAQLQDKDTTICKLKETIKSLRKNNKEEDVNHDRCEFETINKELKNSVAKLLSENECLCKEINHEKHIFKEQFDSIKKTRVHTKEHNLICPTCKKCMLDGTHDMCFLDFVQNMNDHSKSAKKHKKQNVWKPTGHVFTEIGFKWKPTGRTFTLVDNSFPLTRITTTKIVPIKESTPSSVEMSKPEIQVYSKRPKNVKNIGSSKKANIVESKNANHSEPNHTWGSNATDISRYSSLLLLSAIYKSDDDLQGSVGVWCRYQRSIMVNVITIMASKTIRELVMAPIDYHISTSTGVILREKLAEWNGLGNEAFQDLKFTGKILGSNYVSQQPCIPPIRDDWDRLFQPMFDEYFNPPSNSVSPVQEATAPRAIDLADSPMSTSINQDAPSTSTPSTQEQEHPSIISQGFEE